MIQKVKKAEGKMSIEDDSGRGDQPGGATEYGRIDPGYGHQAKYSISSSGRDQSWGGYAHQPLPEANDGASTRRESSAWGSEAGRDNRAYPYHAQGFGDERRTYPVPEI